MSDEVLVSGHVRGDRFASTISGTPRWDPLTLHWLHEAMVLAYATGGSTVMREELAATIESAGLLTPLGLEAPKDPPEWYSMLVHHADYLDEFDEESCPPGELPLDPSLPLEAARLLQSQAPIQACFQAFIESNDSIFSRVFGSTWHALHDSPRTKLSTAHTCALTVERELRRSLVGQSETVAALKRMAFGLELRRGTQGPPATALFLGPPGCGKSLAARQFAAALSLAANATLAERRHLLEVEMTMHVQWASTADLIGDGSRQGAITAFVAKHPNALIICNEFEKAHRKVLESFLPVLDQGFLPSGAGKHVDFRNVVFVFTSNLGSEYWSRPASPEEGSLQVDPMDLLSLAETTDERSEWYKTPVPKELLSRLGKGPVVLFRRHFGHHLFEKVDCTCRVNPEVM